jgi:hypothetical protein
LEIWVALALGIFLKTSLVVDNVVLVRWLNVVRMHFFELN